MGLAERRLAGMEVERGREAFQLSFAMIIIGFFDRFSVHAAPRLARGGLRSISICGGRPFLCDRASRPLTSRGSSIASISSPRIPPLARGTRSWRALRPTGASTKGFAAAVTASSTDGAYPSNGPAHCSRTKKKSGGAVVSFISVFAPGTIRPSSSYGESLRSPSLTAWASAGGSLPATELKYHGASLQRHSDNPRAQWNKASAARKVGEQMLPWRSNGRRRS